MKLSLPLLLLALLLLPACPSANDDDATADDDDATADSQPPGEVTISLSPTSPVTTDDLEWFVIEDAVDPNGDVVAYAAQWVQNGTPRPDLEDQTLVAASQTTRDDVWDLRVTPYDGSGLEGPTATASITILNSLPAATVTIDPASPGTEDDLTLTITIDDADGDPPFTDIAWTLDANPSAAHAGFMVIPSSDTTPGQVWTAEVTPSDQSGPGPVASVSVSVGNTPPTMAHPTLGPADPREGDTLTVSAAADPDIDGDPVTLIYQWFVDGSLVIGQTDSTLTSDWFDKGEEIVAEVTASDGFDGITLASNAVVAVNTPPSVASVSVSPGAGFEASVFTCVPDGWSDPDPADSPQYDYGWFVNGSPSVTTETIDGASFDKDNVLTCTVTPSDSDESGAPVTVATAVTVSNTPPTMASVTIAPSAPTETDTVVAIPSGWADDDGDTEGYVYEWYVVGVLVSTAPTLTGADFDEGDTITLSLVPFDGDDLGPQMTSNIATAVNTPPSVASVNISPSAPNSITDLIAVPSGWSDPDPADTEGYVYEWFMNGVPVGTNAAVLSATDTARGLPITVTITADDGSGTGNSVSSTVVTVLNTPPPPPETEILPEDPDATVDLVCSVINQPADLDGDTITYEYTWFLDGVLEPGYVTDTVPATDTALGDEWTCTMTPWDDEDPGLDALATVVVSDCGHSAYFDAASDQINMSINAPLGLPASGDYTWEMWIKRLGGTEGCLLCNIGSSYTYTYLRSNYFKFKYGIWNGEFRQISFNLPQNQWTHLAIMRSGSNNWVYLDGVQQGSASGSIMFQNNATGWHFDPDNSIVDAVRRSSGALYPPAGGFTPPWPLTVEASTTGLWDFNEGWGTTIRDEANEVDYPVSGIVTTWTTEQAAACP